MTTQAERAAAFRALHERPRIFAIPNPWDAGSAKMLAAMGFEALDTWTPGGPVSMTFGLGYRQSVGSDRGSVVIPRVGGAWTTDALSMRALLSYHRPAGSTGPSGADDPLAPEVALGWDASVEVPLGQGLELAGAARHVPIRIAELGWDRRGASPAFLTGGDASVDEMTLALVQDAGETRTALEVTRGEVEGTLAAILSWDDAPAPSRGRGVCERLPNASERPQCAAEAAEAPSARLEEP